MQACSVTPRKPPFRFRYGRAGVAAFICALAFAGCAPDYEAYGDDMPARPAVRGKRPAAAATPLKQPEVAAKPVPLPAQTLLAVPEKPDCESGGKAEEQRSASAAAAATPPAPAETANAELALRIKLEYERACYRQAEARTRELLQQLQAATGETIRAVKEQQRSAAAR